MKQSVLISLVILILLAACGTTVAPATSAPAQPPTSVPPSATVPATPTPEPTATPVPSPTATPMPGIGSKWTRPADSMTMVFVPAGSFEMGSKDGIQSEAVVHTVTLDGFWIDQTEVTNGMYDLCVAAGKCDPPSQAGSNGIAPSGNFGDTPYKDYPVIYVTWEKANAYCAWAGSASGTTVQLPSEAQWERAARGEDGRNYPWGNDPPNCDLANYTRSVIVQGDSGPEIKDYPCQGNKTTKGDTTTVGSYPQGASPYGALDMAGNVWEWVADWFGDYPSTAVSNPTGASEGTYRALRGGGWNIDFQAMRTFSRLAYNPSYSEGNLGFRCAMPLK